MQAKSSSLKKAAKMNSSASKANVGLVLNDFSSSAQHHQAQERRALLRAEFESEFAPRLNAARAEGESVGRDAGEAATLAKLAPLVDSLNNAIANGQQTIQTHCQLLHAHACQTLAQCLQQLAPSLSDAFTPAVLTPLIQQLLAAPHPAQAVLLVHPSVRPLAEQVLQQQPNAPILQDDATLSSGEARLQWATGGLTAAVQTLVQQWVSQLQASAATNQPPPASPTLAEPPTT